MNKLYEENDIKAIADALREKLGVSTKYKVSQMADAVKKIAVADTLSVSWLDGYTCTYFVTDWDYELSENAAYAISEKIDVTSVSAIEFTVISPDSDFGTIFIGIDENNVITEVQEFKPGNSGIVSFEWCAESNETAYLAIRSMHKYIDQLKMSTLKEK